MLLSVVVVVVVAVVVVSRLTADRQLACFSDICRHRAAIKPACLRHRFMTSSTTNHSVDLARPRWAEQAKPSRGRCYRDQRRGGSSGLSKNNRHDTCFRNGFWHADYPIPPSGSVPNDVGDDRLGLWISRIFCLKPLYSDNTVFSPLPPLGREHINTPEHQYLI